MISVVSSYHINLEIERAALGIQLVRSTNYVKCALTSCNLSSEALFLQSSEKEGSLTILCKKLKGSVVVTPCSRSYSILLHTFIIPPYLLYSFFSYLEASSGKPLTYFIIVSCMCLRCHSLIGKTFVFCIKNNRELYNVKTHIILRIPYSLIREGANIMTKERELIK